MVMAMADSIQVQPGTAPLEQSGPPGLSAAVVTSSDAFADLLTGILQRLPDTGIGQPALPLAPERVASEPLKTGPATSGPTEPEPEDEPKPEDGDAAVPDI